MRRAFRCKAIPRSAARATASAVALALLAALVAAQPQRPAAELGPLVVGVDAYKLMDRLDYRVDGVHVRERMVYYGVHGGVDAGMRIGVGVFPTPQAAQDAFRYLAVRIPMAPGLSETRGDAKLHVWSTSGASLLLFRNMLLDVCLGREPRQAADAAYDLLDYARREPGVMRWGDRVQPPEMSVSVHGEPLTGLQMRIAYRAALGEMVRVARDVGVLWHGGGGKESEAPLQHHPRHVPGEPDFREHGELSFSTNEAGQYTVRLHFADIGNVLFGKTIGFRVSDQEQLPPTAQRRWVVPGNTLYFLRDADADWQNQSPREREWVDWGQFVSGTCTDNWHTQDEVLTHLGAVVRPQWVPARRVLDVGMLGGRTGRPAYYAPYRLDPIRVLYMGTLDGGFLLYIEHAAEEGESPQAPAVEEVLQDHMLSGGVDAQRRFSWRSRTLRRYRAGKPEGPYALVDILLLRVGPGEALSLRSPAY